VDFGYPDAITPSPLSPPSVNFRGTPAPAFTTFNVVMLTGARKPEKLKPVRLHHGEGGEGRGPAAHHVGRRIQNRRDVLPESAFEVPHADRALVGELPLDPSEAERDLAREGRGRRDIELQGGLPNW
jgi:hypothetical protein